MGSSKSTTTEEEWVQVLLKTFRFHPSEEDMVELLKKKKKMQSKACCFMPETDHKPWDSDGDDALSLFKLFLKKLMQGEGSHPWQFIPVVDVCKYEPEDLPGRMFPDSPYEPREWYCFGSLDYKSINSSRCNRLTTHGFWKITGRTRKIGLTCETKILSFYNGRAPNSEWTGWVMQLYYFTKTKRGSPSNPNQQQDFVLWRLKKNMAKNKSDNKKLKDDSVCDESADPGTGACMASNSEDYQAAANHMILEADERLAYKELADAVLGSSNQDDGEPGGCVSSGFDDQGVVDIIQECLDLPSPPSPHQPPQPGNVLDVCNDGLTDPGTGVDAASNSANQAAAINHVSPVPDKLLACKQPEHVQFGNSYQDNGEPGGLYLSDFDDILQGFGLSDFEYVMQEPFGQPGEGIDSPFPPELPKLGNVPDVHTDECSNRPSPIGDNDSYLTNKNNISTNYETTQVSNITNSFQTRATGERTSEDYSPVSLSELGNVPHANNYIGCNESQSPCPEIPALFSQRS